MSKGSKTFEGILDSWFEPLLEEVPTFATIAAGLKSGEGKLGSLDPAFHESRERARRKILRKLDSISPSELSAQQHLDRLALKAQLTREMEDYGRGRHSLEPSAPAVFLDVVFHELQRADEDGKRSVTNLRSLLSQCPDFFNGALESLDRPERVWVKVMEQTAQGGEALLDGVQLLFGGAECQAKDAALVSRARKSLRHYAAVVKEREFAPSGSYAIGRQAVERRISDELGLDYTAGQIEKLAEAEVIRIGRELELACKRFGGGKPAEVVIRSAREAWRPDKPLLELYRIETQRIAKLFRKANAVTFPDPDELQVKPVPEFLKHLIPTAAYSAPGAFSRKQRGIFWVNDLSESRPTPEEKLKEQQQHFGISLTSAHEAYPGHHLQFVTANRHPRKWRRLFAHAVFYEGWTLWCEQMMVDLGIDTSPWLKVQQLHDALWRCHRILIDVRLQTGRYSYGQAVSHLQRHLGFTKARAEAEINWYTGQPCVPMSYWLGRLENERLRQKLMAGRGWTLKQFNDWLLSFGTLPQAWLEKYGLN